MGIDFVVLRMPLKAYLVLTKNVNATRRSKGFVGSMKRKEYLKGNTIMKFKKHFNSTPEKNILKRSLI